MIGKPFQFQRDAPQRLCPGRDAATRQRFYCLAIRYRVANRRVTRQRFHIMNGPFVGSAY